jgi:hypothetical protein
MRRLERWSRRKRGVESDVESGSLEAPREPELTPGAEDAEVLGESMPDDAEAPPPPGSLDDQLPDPASLEAGSDFSVFLQQGVSQGLKRRALRRLWHTGNYNVRDGLDDYDGDYSQLQPLAREAAQRLRHWSRQLGDRLEERLEEAEAGRTDAGSAPPVVAGAQQDAAQQDAETPPEAGDGDAPGEASPATNPESRT